MTTKLDLEFDRPPFKPIHFTVEVDVDRREFLSMDAFDEDGRINLYPASASGLRGLLMDEVANHLGWFEGEAVSA